MKTLLLCGYRASLEISNDALGLKRDLSGTTLIERRIAELREFGSRPLCVLSGAFADEQLRQCPRLSEVELAYDNNSKQVSLTSNLVTGLEELGRDACFVLPVEVPLPDRSTWNQLLEAVEQESLPEKTSLIQMVTPQGAPWHFGFPLVVTRFGNRQLQRLQDFTTLLDPRLKYLHLVKPNEVATSASAI